MQFTLNGTEYTIETFHDIRMAGHTRSYGYYWTNGDSEGEVRETQAEAQQDAIRHAESELPSDDSMERQQPGSGIRYECGEEGQP